MNIIITLIAVVIFFVILIVPHEFGHFIAARALGVKVNEFSFGMGPALFSKQGKETLYSVRAFPIGGYCALEGENEDTGDPRAFNSKPWWKKIIILVAGVTMNILTAILILTIISSVSGMVTNTIDEVQKGSPAEVSGLMKGDTLVAYETASGEQEKIKYWNDIAAINEDNKSGYTLVYERGGKEKKAEVVPEEQDKRLIIGITPVISHDPIMAVGISFTTALRIEREIIKAFSSLFSNGLAQDDVSGPVGIVSAVGKTAGEGIRYFMILTAIMCLNLAFINILPFPALDGGRILFVVIRSVTGKMISDELEAKIHAIGMIVLLGFMLFITVNDVSKLMG